MKLRAGLPLLLAALATAGPAWAGNFMNSVWANSRTEQSPGGAYSVPEAANLIGPYGQPIQAIAPASYREPTGADYARHVLQQSMPPQMLMQANFQQHQNPYGHGWARRDAAAGYGPNCGPQGCGPASGYPMPPVGGGMPLGPMPPRPGPMPPGGPGFNSAAYSGPPGAVAAVGVVGAGGPGACDAPYGVARSEIRFLGPAGMQISWFAPRADGKVGFTKEYLEAPARYNFVQASIYRLKISNLPGRPGVDLYPTLEVVPANGKTATFLAHSAVPIRFTEADLEQVALGNFIVKVIYLPDPQYQDLAATGVDELVSSPLEPGVDPIVEAKRRGSILAIVRVGDIDLEAPNTPAMDAPPSGGNPGGGPGNNFTPPNVSPPSASMGGTPPPLPTLPPSPPPVPAPKAQVPVKTEVPPAPTAPATPLGKMPVTGQLQPVSATEAPKPIKPPQRTTLMDLLGKPTSSR